MRGRWIVLCLFPVAVVAGAMLRADEPTPAERGRQALTTRAFIAAFWKVESYDNAWKHWGQDVKDKPADYDAKFRERYGLHVAPYDNGKYPMGLREGKGLFGKGLAPDCMLCHGG